jgi:hypothetical protein
MPATILGEHAITVPVGTTAQRPGSPTAGMLRWNTTRNLIEYYDTGQSSWIGVGEFFATGGDQVITDGSYKYHVFKNSGSISVSSGSATAEYTVVAGGGAGGNGTSQNGGNWWDGGGGGAGGM